MNWSMYLGLSMGVFLLGIVLALFLHSSRRKILFLDSFKIFVSMIFVSALILFVPVYAVDFSVDGMVDSMWKAFLLAIYNTVHLFAVNGDVFSLADLLKNEIGIVYEIYICYAVFIAVVISLVTLGFILSFFKNIMSYFRYILGWNKEAYIFTELNRKSITLAEDLIRNDKNRMIVFMDYFESNEEESFELSQRAKDIGAICFKKDIHGVNFAYHGKNKEISFFVIGINETENMEHVLSLVKRYKNLEGTNLYIFSDRVESELLLTSIDKGKMKVRRVNEIRALINRMLYVDGVDIFKTAYPVNENLKKIHAVIVGLGKHGSEILKALSWYCQMDGYELEIDAFDKDMEACERLYTQCPELLSEELNGVSIEGEPIYKINLHGNISVDSREFVRKISEIVHPTYVFVALGSDAENIRVATYLRMLFERNKIKPVIKAIVYNSKEAEVIKGITNFKKQKYNISCIGDFESSYSEDVILESDLEKDALKRHMQYANGDPEVEEDFWKYVYNYQSSMATAIHAKARIECEIPYAGKEEKDLCEADTEKLKTLEHRRWSAYMRTEGYCYSGSLDASSRNDLGKLHHNLVPYKKLTTEDKNKDKRIAVE